MGNPEGTSKVLIRPPVFRKITIKYKLLMFCLLIIFIPITLIGYFYIGNITSIILEQNTRDSRHAVHQIAQSMTSAVKLTEDLADLIYLNRILNRELAREYTNPGDSADVYIDILNPFITNHKQLHSSLFAAITIYLDNDTFLQNGEEVRLATAEIKNQAWYQEAIREGIRGHRVWGDALAAAYDLHEQGYHIPLYRNLNCLGESIGVLEIKVDERYFHSILKNEDTSRRILILNGRGTIISSNDRDMIGQRAEAFPYLSGIYDSRDGHFDASLENGTVKVIYDTIGAQDAGAQWKVVSMVPLNSLLDKVNAARNLGLLICLISFAVLTVIIVQFSKRFTGRIEQLVDKTQKVVEGEYGELVDISGDDEIGKLGFSFNKMLNHLNALIYEVYEDKIQIQEYALKQKETELLVLQNQINPHFLYNTLDAIRMHAVINGEESIADMLVSLSSLLRYSISRGKELVTIQDELTHVQNYMSLMRIRYEDQIGHEITVPEEILSCITLKLILQPLVENAIEHGIRLKKGKGMIRISGYPLEERLIIEVKDNGAGIPQERLSSLNRALKEGRESEAPAGKIGLQNVNNRIRLYFGQDYGLSVESVIDQGTIVRITLPLKAGGEKSHESYSRR